MRSMVEGHGRDCPAHQGLPTPSVPLHPEPLTRLAVPLPVPGRIDYTSIFRSLIAALSSTCPPTRLVA